MSLDQAHHQIRLLNYHLHQYKYWLADARRIRQTLQHTIDKGCLNSTKLENQIQHLENEMMKNNGRHKRIQKKLKDRLVLANLEISKLNESDKHKV